MTEEELEHVRRSVADRVDRGWTVLVQPEESVVVSPVGMVPKANGKLRTINHLSWPRRRPSHPSVNDGIPIEDVSMSYGNLDGLFDAVRLADGPVELWKADLADAFYHIVVAEADSRLLAFELDGKTYRDTTLNFGGRSSPYLFNLLAEALHWVCEACGLALDHYLDDSFGLVPRGSGAATLDAYGAICTHLGVTVSPTKCLHGTALEILGIWVDSEARLAWISDDRKAALRTELDALLGSATAGPAALQALAGTLNFVARVCPAGRAFMRRIYDAATTAAAAWRPVPMSGPLRDELRWWRATLDRWDGTRLLRHTPSIEVWTDAATSGGLGAHLGPREACLAAWSRPTPTQHSGKDILFLECLALLEAVRGWAAALSGHKVVCKLDNMALVAVIRSGRCDQRATQTLVREIFAVAIERHFDLSPDWVPSEVNDVADALSRSDLDALARNRPHVLALLAKQQPDD